MLKALRKSTLKKRESREERERLQFKLIKKKKKKSSITKAKEERRARLDILQREIQENQVIIEEGISNLSSFQDCSESSDSLSSSEVSDAVFESPESSPKASQLGSEVSLLWDNQVDLESPLKDTSDLLDTFGFSGDKESESSPPPALSRDRSASVSINRASYLCDETGEILNLQPVCRNLNRVLDNNPGPSGASGLISQDSFLERNLQAREIENLNIIEESEENVVGDESVDEDHNLLEQGNNFVKMDEANFNGKVKALKKGYRRVQDKISSYTSQNVTVADKDEYKEQMRLIRNKYDDFIEEVNTVIDELDEENEALRVEELNKMKTEATSALMKNENEVKNRLTQLLAEYEENKPLSKGEQKIAENNVMKLKKRMGFIKEKSVEVKNVILKAKKAAEMTDNEIRECIIESRDWEKSVKEIVSRKEKAEEDSVGLDIEAKEITDLKEEVQNAVDILATKIENLKKEDKTRGLFTAVSKNLSRENVIFPEAFAGGLGENVFKFKDKFMQAIHDSQVREKDQVEVLRKHLTGEAKKLVGGHHKSLDSAMDALEEYFGDTAKIWEKCKENVKKKLGGNFGESWGSYGDQRRVLALATAIEFLREAAELAENYPELKNEIYHSTTLALMKDLFPYDYIEKYNEIVEEKNIDQKKKLENLMEFLKHMKASAIKGVEEMKRKRENSRRPPGGREPSRTNTAFRGKGTWKNKDDSNGKCYFCGGSDCITSWNGLGCLDLYQLQTRDERRNWLQAHRLCFSCGCNFSMGPSRQGRNFRHMCHWFGKGKLSAKCSEKDCWIAAATCKHKNNLSDELEKWLKNAKIDIKNLAQGILYGFPTNSSNLDGQTNGSCIKKDKETVSSIPMTKMSKLEREKLQRGEMSRPMKDDELVKLFEEDVKKVTKGVPNVKSVPEGDPVFIMNVFKGATRPVTAFIDSGCNCWVAKKGIPENELFSCKLNSGPISMGVASALTVKADAEWASLLPLADGGYQVVRGLTLPEVTQDMPSINMQEVFTALKKKHKNTEAIQKLKVPKTISGQIDMIIGIKYANIYPELVHEFPNGLAVYKSKLMPVVPGEIACIGGPVEALEGLEGVYGGNTLGYLTQLTLSMKTCKPRLEFFPDYKQIDADIPGIHELFEAEEIINVESGDDTDEKTEKQMIAVKRTADGEEEEDVIISTNKKRKKKKKKKNIETKALEFVNFESMCQECGDQIIDDVIALSVTAQGELKKFMKYQEAGLDTSYRCPKCRGCDDCIKGTGFEKISLKQEAEQELIKTSVKIDVEKGRPMAHLPFTLDPKENLKDNSFAAIKRLGNVCKKYGKDEKIKKEINAAFEKLKTRGHMKLYEDLNVEQRKTLDNEVGYTIPWDIVWKESSLSTPARTVYDASSKTSSGYSLNDILATGIPDLAKLVDVLLDWHIGPTAFVGDVSQFYCSVGLVEECWPYQKIVLRENMNPNGKLIKAVIVSAIFGVCSSGGQSEEAIKQFCDMIKMDFPVVVKLLLKSRYVDDILKSLRNKSDALDLIKATEENLKNINMNIKGWAISGEDPPEQMSDDSASVGFSGLTWFPKIDCFKLNISSLHFGKKKRGKHSSNLDFYDPSKYSSMEEFLKNKNVTRRKCTSVVARLYDNYGKLEPLKLRFKDDLRKLIYENPEWDDPISSAQLVRWTENFKMIDDCRGLLYSRCLVPDNAVSLKANFWILCDAADSGIMAAAYARFPIPDNKWSCQNLLAKSLLAPDSWTIPKKELQALTVAANMKVIIERSLEDWVDEIFIGGDSEIALAWTIYENVKLNVFHRNRVNNIRSKVSLDQLHHVQGTENCADTGTRPDSVTLESILPGSEWLEGKEWMTRPYEEALKQGVIKSVHDIKLSNEAKKVMKEGIVFDQFEADDDKVAVTKINLIDVKKVAEREAFSEYIYPPLKRSFRPTVRIISLVLLAIRKFKEGALRAKIKAGEKRKEELDKLKPKAVKFSMFEIIGTEESKTEKSYEEYKKMFNITGVKCDGVVPRKSSRKKSKLTRFRRKSVLVRLTDEDLSEGLEYLFKKATGEIIQFENRKEIEKLGILRDGIYFCNSRILDSQELKTVGCLSESLDVETFTGIKFCVPIVSKHSPLAISLAIHLHYIVNHHKGVESSYRMSLQHARILQGRQLFKEIGDDCIFCKKLRLKYVRQLMGPLSQNQLCISPIFYFTYIDMWGPLSVYCPGYEKRTRNRKQEYKVYMLVMGCVVTGAVNCQIIEKKDTDAVLDGLTRFFCETSVPKICYPDQDGALMKALNEGEISILDLQGRLHKERGILFETCLPQGHYQHGRIERRIKMLQESLERSEIRLTASATATGWQTIAKVIENEVNSIPLGYLHHQGSLNPLMRVLCPSLLKNGTFSDRAPKGLFTIPDSAADMMDNIVTIYNMWFRLWNTTYLPLVMDRPKWHIEEENLQTNDLVYFKLTDSKLSADWKVGKVEHVKIGRDGKVREVGIAYKNMDEDGDWRHSLVERPVRSVVKLMNIEDTSIIEDMKKVQEEVKVILNKQTPVLDDKSICEEDENINKESKETLDVNENQNEVEDVKKPKIGRRKRKTELERLLDGEKLEISPGERRSAFKKHKFYAPTENQDEENLFYSKTMLAFEERKSVRASLLKKCEVGATTAALFSGVIRLEGGGGLQDAGRGEPGPAEGVRDMGGAVCTENFYDCDHSVYLI